MKKKRKTNFVTITFTHTYTSKFFIGVNFVVIFTLTLVDVLKLIENWMVDSENKKTPKAILYSVILVLNFIVSIANAYIQN